MDIKFGGANENYENMVYYFNSIFDYFAYYRSNGEYLMVYRTRVLYLALLCSYGYYNNLPILLYMELLAKEKR